MGIDIRDGLQLECIQCALCIDACDDIMTKIGRPKRLIAYDTDANIQHRLKGEPTRYRLLRPRTVVYAAVLVVVGLVMLAGLLTRSDIDLNVIRDRNPLYVMLSDGSIRNGYTLKIINKRHQPARFAIAVEGLPQASARLLGLDGIDQPVEVAPDALRSVRLFVTAPRAALTEKSAAITIRVRDLDAGTEVVNDTTFKAPIHE